MTAPAVLAWGRQFAAAAHGLNARLLAPAGGPRRRFRPAAVDQAVAGLWGCEAGSLETQSWDRGIASLTELRRLAEPFVAHLKVSAYRRSSAEPARGAAPSVNYPVPIGHSGERRNRHGSHSRMSPTASTTRAASNSASTSGARDDAVAPLSRRSISAKCSGEVNRRYRNLPERRSRTSINPGPRRMKQRP